MKITLSEKIKERELKNPEEVARIMTKVLKGETEIDRDKEHFWGIYLNARNRIKEIELISLGTVDANLCHPREVYRPAIGNASAQIILCHNHPSGDVEPSKADLEITHRLVEAGKIIGIEVIDHIIINEKGGFYSFKRKKLI